MNLSAHPARANPSLAALPPPSDAEYHRLLPEGQGLVEFARPLRSRRITHPRSLVRDGPPPADASLLSPFADSAYRVFAWHHQQGSHVPCHSPDQAHAHYTPDAVEAISRHCLHRSGEREKPSILTSSYRTFDASVRSLIAHLLGPHLTSLTMPFPQRSRPQPLCRSRLGRFDDSPCRASPRGLPSSLT